MINENNARERRIAMEAVVDSYRRGKVKAARVFTFRPGDIKSIRLKLGKSQSEFALMIGVSLATLQNWEQGRRMPEGPARALLKVAADNPKAVADTLGA